MELFRPFKYSVSYVKISCSFVDEEAKKGPKRRGAPRSAGRTAANTGPVSFETLSDVLIITDQFRENEYSHA